MVRYYFGGMCKMSLRLSYVRDCRNTQKCGMAHVSLWRRPEFVPRKKNRINQYECCAPAAGCESKLSGGWLPVTRLIASLLQRVDPAKIAMMDCGFKLIRIFQRELRWMFELHTDARTEQHCVALNYTFQRDITPPTHMNIDPCVSEGKVDMTWEANSAEWQRRSLTCNFPLLPDRSESSGWCHV